ncbi:MAG: 23S rRNA (uracil(1939)-C(5))-methyltransferase RlmD [Acidobacteria bacterium]|nr:MAG: 23S rRNA (uracil(1939)-C(5))-methyltransferase RlmD [Acidobacteriota bacterium]
MKLVKGQVFEADVLSAGFEGVGVARVDELVVFVRGGVPGDKVLARVRRVKRRHAEATVEEVLAPSPHRVEPECPYFQICGGCSWQNADYQFQLEFKRDQVRDLLSRIGGVSDVEISSTLGSPRLYHYRNKMEFTFGARRWLTQKEIADCAPVRKDFALGLHVPQRFDKVLDLDTCHLASPVTTEIVNRVRQLAIENNWPPYDTIAHEGYLKNLVIRVSEHTGDVLANLVTSDRRSERMESLTKELTSNFPKLRTVINSVNPGRSPVAIGKEEIYFGPGNLIEKIGPISYTLEASTFFQPNTLQAERLYGVVRDLAQLTGNETLLDLYCGIGGITLFLASGVKRAIGVENQARSVELARLNAETNSIANCEFLEFDAAGYMRQLAEDRSFVPDVVTIDPPRVGMHPDMLESLLSLKPSRIVYVSCNPATQARDLEVLVNDYQVDAIQPVDMFPQTYHIENVVALRRR